MVVYQICIATFTAIVSVRLMQCDCCSAIISAQLFQCYCCGEIGSVHLLQYTCWSAVVAVKLLQCNCCCAINAVQLGPDTYFGIFLIFALFVVESFVSQFVVFKVSKFE